MNITPNTTKVNRNFLKLFVGRKDVVPEHWKSKKGKSGYSPMCTNKFKRPICTLGKGGKCKTCKNVDHISMSDALLAQHFSGKRILGIYPLMPDNTTRFLAFDFDRHKKSQPDPQQEAVGFVEVCELQNLPAHMVRSKSGKGYHVWLFFDSPVAAWKARMIGFALLKEAKINNEEEVLI